MLIRRKTSAFLLEASVILLITTSYVASQQVVVCHNIEKLLLLNCPSSSLNFYSNQSSNQIINTSNRYALTSNSTHSSLTILNLDKNKDQGRSAYFTTKRSSTANKVCSYDITLFSDLPTHNGLFETMGVRQDLQEDYEQNSFPTIILPHNSTKLQFDYSYKFEALNLKNLIIDVQFQGNLTNIKTNVQCFSTQKSDCLQQNGNFTIPVNASCPLNELLLFLRYELNQPASCQPPPPPYFNYRISVHYPPTISLDSKANESNVNFSCKVLCASPMLNFTYTWFIGKNDTYKITTNSTSNDISVELSSLTVNDETDITCCVSNGVVDSSCKSIKVTKPTTSDVCHDINERLELKCNQSNAVFYTQDGNVEQPIAGNTTKYVVLPDISSTGLIILDLTKQDQGNSIYYAKLNSIVNCHFNVGLFSNTTQHRGTFAINNDTPQLLLQNFSQNQTSTLILSEDYKSVEFNYTYTFEALNLATLDVSTSNQEILMTNENNQLPCISTEKTDCISERATIVITMKNTTECPLSTLPLQLSYRLTKHSCQESTLSFTRRINIHYPPIIQISFDNTTGFICKINCANPSEMFDYEWRVDSDTMSSGLSISGSNSFQSIFPLDSDLKNNSTITCCVSNKISKPTCATFIYYTKPAPSLPMKSNSDMGIIITVAVSIGALLTLALIIFSVIRFKKRKQQSGTNEKAFQQIELSAKSVKHKKRNLETENSLYEASSPQNANIYGDSRTSKRYESYESAYTANPESNNNPMGSYYYISTENEEAETAS